MASNQVDASSNLAGCVMRNVLCWITDWIGWLFVEIADRLFIWADYDWAYDDNGWVWYMKPYGFVADRTYDLGNWSYGLFD